MAGHEQVSLLPGTSVRWQFGGPVMVVKVIRQPDPVIVTEALCVWFSPDQHFHEAWFPVSELLSASGTAPSPPTT